MRRQRNGVTNHLLEELGGSSSIRVWVRREGKFVLLKITCYILLLVLSWHSSSSCRIHSRDHFKKKYAVDDVHFNCDVSVPLWLQAVGFRQRSGRLEEELQGYYWGRVGCFGRGLHPGVSPAADPLSTSQMTRAKFKHVLNRDQMSYRGR